MNLMSCEMIDFERAVELDPLSPAKKELEVARRQVTRRIGDWEREWETQERFRIKPRMVLKYLISTTWIYFGIEKLSDLDLWHFREILAS